MVTISREGAIYCRPVRRSGHLAGLDSKVVVHGDSQLLLAAEVPLSGLYGDIPEQKLDLIQFAACEMTQTGARPPKVMGCQLFDS